jgi:hypothetical protein
MPRRALFSAMELSVRYLQWQHAFARKPSTPSLAMMGDISSAVTGSAHHHPNPQRNTNPTSRIADNQAQKSA